ncbi:MAG: glycosyltransferase [Chloroflexi bacterium]|nr:glycosyltransferase [Chloroflexota bacterium]
MQPYLSVIIPAYTEEKRIGKTLAAVYDYLRAQTFSWELLIVLDGPTDNTPAIVADFAQGKTGIRWIDRRQNRGKGYSVRQGMLAARGKIRLFTDADNSTDMKHFDRMKPLFDAGANVVIASRDAKDAPTARQAVPQPFTSVFGQCGQLVHPIDGCAGHLGHALRLQGVFRRSGAKGICDGAHGRLELRR